MISFAIPRGWRPNNPCVHVKKLKGGEGYTPWDFGDIDSFKMRARKDLWHAAILALYSGQRLNDVLNMRWDDIANGLIAVVQNKTRKKLWIPMHANLRAALHDIPRCGVTILTSTKGQPWTLIWTKELNRPEMKLLRKKQLVFHGLRKSAVVFLLEAGCTDAEVSAITGQSRQMVEHYAKQVNQRKLAATAISKWEASETNSPEQDGDD